jgi:hypothetical protein
MEINFLDLLAHLKEEAEILKNVCRILSEDLEILIIFDSRQIGKKKKTTDNRSARGILEKQCTPANVPLFNLEDIW